MQGSLELDLSKEELQRFASEFLKRNPNYVGEPDLTTGVRLPDGSIKSRAPSPETVGYDWPTDPLEKLKVAWFLEEKRRKKEIQTVTGLAGLPSSESVLNAVETHLNREQDFRSIKATSQENSQRASSWGQPAEFKAQELAFLKGIQADKQREEARHDYLLRQVADIAETLREYAGSQQAVFESSKELQTIANGYLEQQLEEAQKTSADASRGSTIAIVLALISMIVSTAVGILPMIIPDKSDEILREIVKVNKELIAGQAGQIEELKRLRSLVKSLPAQFPPTVPASEAKVNVSGK